MAHSSQTRIVWKVDGQFLHARWWLQRPILDAHPLLHFGQMKVWDADGRAAACSFCLLSFSFAASCLSVSNLKLAFFTDERQLSRSEASRWSWLMADSRLCKLSLQLIFVTLSWSTTIAFSFFEPAGEDCFGHAYVFHPYTVDQCTLLKDMLTACRTIATSNCWLSDYCYVGLITVRLLTHRNVDT